MMPGNNEVRLRSFATRFSRISSLTDRLRYPDAFSSPSVRAVLCMMGELPLLRVYDNPYTALGTNEPWQNRLDGTRADCCERFFGGLIGRKLLQCTYRRKHHRQLAGVKPFERNGGPQPQRVCHLTRVGTRGATGWYNRSKEMRVVAPRFRFRRDPVRKIDDPRKVDHVLRILNDVEQRCFFTHQFQPPPFQLLVGGGVCHPLTVAVARHQHAGLFKHFTHGRKPELQWQMDGWKMRYVANELRIAIRIIGASTGKDICARHKATRAMPLEQQYLHTVICIEEHDDSGGRFGFNDIDGRAIQRFSKTRRQAVCGNTKFR